MSATKVTQPLQSVSAIVPLEELREIQSALYTDMIDLLDRTSDEKKEAFKQKLEGLQIRGHGLLSRRMKLETMIGLLTRRHVSANHGPGCHRECSELKEKAAEMGYVLVNIGANLLKVEPPELFELAVRLTKQYVVVIQDICLAGADEYGASRALLLTGCISAWLRNTAPMRARVIVDNERWLYTVYLPSEMARASTPSATSSETDAAE